MELVGKKIVLGITGSIAAYKTPDLVRQLIKAGAEVRVLLTAEAHQFVAPLSLSTVSKHPVWSDLSDGTQWNNHVELGIWADALLIAPCTANTLARLALGLCDNIISAVYLSARCPVFIAPAMDEDMWKHSATRQNVRTLQSYQNQILPVANGELASGLVGPGRMLEPEQIVAHLIQHFNQHPLLSGVRALVTAGPTYERIDPVRFIGNFSTGKMGIAIADALSAAGATVTLILGPSSLLPTNDNVKVIHVESADEMYTKTHEFFEQTEIAVMSAAVADYKPENAALQKIKKKADTLSLSLVKNKDILASIGAIKKNNQLVIGFALETQNGIENAQIKLQSKKADLIVLNQMNEDGAGFGHNTNKVTLLSDDKKPEALPIMLKTELARVLVDKIIAIRNEKNKGT